MTVDSLITASSLGWTPPKTGGVYAIRNVQTGKAYVGSSKNMRRRIGHHVRLLEKGLHHAFPLQKAWIKYGSQHFELVILELVDSSKQFQKEDFWIAQLQSHMAKKGYNVLPSAGSSLGASRKPLTDEEKRRLVDGNRRWWLEAPPEDRFRRKQASAECNSKTYIVRNPDGIETVIKNLKAFCRQKGLAYSSVMRTANLRQLSAGGWHARPLEMTYEESLSITQENLKAKRRDYLAKNKTVCVGQKDRIWAIYKHDELLAVFENGRDAAEFLGCPYYSVLQARLKDRPLTKNKLRGIHVSPYLRTVDRCEPAA